MAGTTYGQGHILIGNYYNPPYAQIYYPFTGQAVQASDGLTFQVFYGAGVVSSFASLTPGLTFQIDPIIGADYDPGAGHGAGGYFANVDQTVPGWTPGSTWSFAYEVATPGYGGQSPIWQEDANIVPLTEPPNSSQSFGLGMPIPEPSTFALAALGAVSLLISRRRTLAVPSACWAEARR